jgi:hypothetical protein
MENLYHIKRTVKGAVLIMALLLLILLSLLGLSAVELGLMQSKMQKNLDTKNISLQRAESGLVMAESALSKGNKAGQQNERWSYIIVPLDIGPDKESYNITATGIAGSSRTVLQVTDMLESVPQVDGKKIIKQYRLVWNELTGE